ncbi:PH domain-containing protein [Adlercreutzia sp. ZJ141]|uniref:PH domain-containing protein n=1 Tax=Adlercreutzia sp. ZJ141 TaxID=2709406 RepID=UPI0013EBAA42|nr:PH domain-containing protein [Adlercreutzia sp. ZJ141]
MRAVPSHTLNPKIKRVWRINDALWLTLAYVCIECPFLIGAAVDPEASWAWLIVAGATALYAACLVIWLVVLPPIRHARWRYEVGEHELDIACGIIWRKRFIIPFVRVQNTDTKQGPILRAFGLASVTTATAAGEHVIPGLTFEEADRLRDLIAKQARLAQEDV